ncbi:cbb3-type cytochrome c oxidase subunit I [Magnetovibrio sp. PR-2]|uniref:cbb3-type cytochrome c oxidase subunit I n=1 Tax=Magnetovibrio sp. PR-2 TaxID=3120356 RepID=UPI002FCE5808
MHAPALPPLMDRLHTVMDGPGARLWLTRWVVLGLIVLGTAGLFALPLAFGRAPGISDYFPWFVANFHRFLVVHVDFSFVVFFLCIFAAVAHVTAYRLSNGSPRLTVLEFAAFRFAVVAVAGMFTPVLPLSEEALSLFPMLVGEPVMSNYVPVVTSPMFYLSLLVLAVAMAFMAAFALVNLWERPAAAKAEHGQGIDVLSLAGLVSAAVYLLAFGYFLFTWKLLDGQPITHQFNEELFWAGGHVLQFINVALLLGAWYAISSSVFGPSTFNPMTVVLALGLLAVAAFTTSLISVFYEIFSADWLLAFTNWQYAFAPVTLIVALPLVKNLMTGTNKPWKNPGFVALVLSPLVFGIGGVMGLFVDGQDTRTPAHYHGMIAGVTLSFIALYYVVFLPLLGRTITQPKLALASVWLFGVSQALASSGLFIAGGHGAARKTAGADQGLDGFAMKLGMGLNGGAGLLAIIGGALFVWVTASALLGGQKKTE